MKTTQSYISETQLKILSLFTNSFSREYYIREVVKLLNIGPRTAQLNLENLERLGVLESESRGKIKLYRLRINQIAKDYLQITENYKKIVFLDRNPLINEIVTKLYSLVSGICIIFGSYVKGTQKKDSDLDILVIGSYNRERVKDITKKYGIQISVKKYEEKTFEKGIGEDILIKEMLKNHIIFKGVEPFLDRVL